MSTKPNVKPDTASKPSLTLKRRLNAPPAKVFRAWTDPEKLKRWFGPEGVETLSAQSDPRVGGRYRILARSPDGAEHEVTGIFREVVPDERLVFTWAWRDTPERESLVTVALARDGTGTLLTLTHEQFFDADARDRHQHGWEGSMVRLERVLQEL
jgi:uncharacterized protein YndB with AHSA1/START domain